MEQLSKGLQCSTNVGKQTSGITIDSTKQSTSRAMTLLLQNFNLLILDGVEEREGGKKHNLEWAWFSKALQTEWSCLQYPNGLNHPKVYSYGCNWTQGEVKDYKEICWWVLKGCVMQYCCRYFYCCFIR